MKSKFSFNRFAALLVSLLLVVSLFAGCSKKSNGDESSEQSTSGQSTSGTSDGSEELKLPIVDKPLTLTYFTIMNSGVSEYAQTYNDINCYKEMEKRTGIHIDFRNVPSNQADEQFNLMLAAGDYPDIIDWYWPSVKTSPEQLILDGIAIQLDELIDQYAPNYKEIINSDPKIKKDATTSEGKIGAFLGINTDDRLGVWFGGMIRKDWLDKLNLKVPTTIDEWHTVLKAFREKDPNENGEADELPISFNTWGDPLGAIRWGRAFLGAWGIAMDYYQEKGVVKFGPLQPEFKEFLTVMNKWYEDKLIDPDYAATDNKLMDFKITNQLMGAFFGGASGSLGKYAKMMKEENPEFKLAPVPYAVLKSGDKPQLGQMDSRVVNCGAVITTSCKYVKEAVRWLDYPYSEEGNLLFSFGIEGESYSMENGNPIFTDRGLYPENYSPRIGYTVGDFGGPHLCDFRMYEQRIALPEQKEALKVWADSSPEKIIPGSLVIDPVEMELIASKETDIKTYLEEMINKFIMGVESLENYDNFAKKLRDMDVDSLIKARQNALDKYNNR